MTSFEIAQLSFSKAEVAAWRSRDAKHGNWPVVYVLDNKSKSGKKTSNSGLRDMYVGESLNAVGRLRQHLESPAKQHLINARVILHEKFNKSVCLDLESYLIRMMAGDGANQMLNRNNGITDAQYYQREAYRAEFKTIFNRLRSEGVFTRGISEIENSDLFKLSPYKALTDDQANSVEEILERFFADLSTGNTSAIVIQGDPGTGKTVVAIYLIKLLMDIAALNSLEDLNGDSQFANFFTTTNQSLLHGCKIGLVVPQQSLRSTIKEVFRKTRGLDPKSVLTPFEVGKADLVYDLLIVDETHRLNQRASQPSGALNGEFIRITENLFGSNDLSKTQLDWIVAKSRQQIFLLDAMQSVRPADLPQQILSSLVADTRATGKHFQLRTQMRVQAGSDYVSYIRWILDPNPLSVPRARLSLGTYDFRMFDTVKEMHDTIKLRNERDGLSRMVAGFAWPWQSKKKKELYDIEIDDAKLRWNTTTTDWISSKNAVEEVGSVHTVQGYDLNFVGVIIGKDLRFDTLRNRLCVDRKSYHDKKGKQNNRVLGRDTSDEDLLRFITQIYAVLMTRGIKGTYVYVCDRDLRNYLAEFIPSSSGRPKNSAFEKGDCVVRRGVLKRRRAIRSAPMSEEL